LLQRLNPEDIKTYLPQTKAVQKLMNIEEMGELFKVIGLSRKLDIELRGFAGGDRSRML
jgi:SAM-dependent MidA family methyltransferase